MSSEKSRNTQTSGAPKNKSAGGAGGARRLRAVPDIPDGENRPGDAGYVYEEPDVVGLERKRAEYRQARPDITDEELDTYLSLYRSHLSPQTIETYVSALTPFYKHAEVHGFHPLKCDAADIETYLLDLMTSGKQGADGARDPKRPYSPTHFKKFLAALKRAAEAQELPNPGEDVDIRRLTRGYTRLRGSLLPRNGKTELLFDQLVEIERRAREGSTMQAAMPRAAIALGCDQDLYLTIAELCGLTFADVALASEQARITTSYRSTSAETSIIARPGDPACPVKALTDLRSAVHRRMRAARKGRPPTDKQIGAEPLFRNAHTGGPLSRTGLTKMVARACAGLPGVPEARTGRLPTLDAEQRRQAMNAALDVKTTRDLALVFHSVFTTSRVSETSAFRVGDVEVFGHDSDNMNVYSPLVAHTDPDGTHTEGIIDRVAEITETGLFDSDGANLYESGLILGAHNTYSFGTKTQDRHENWYPAQPGWAACPVRLLILWLKAYDRLMIEKHGRRLAAADPLFTNLKCPGEPLANMSQALGGIVKTALADLGINPENYSAHSLRKTRPSYVLSQNGSMTESMVHDGRSSEVTGLVYAHRNPRNPLDGDPTVDAYKRAADPAEGDPATTGKTAEAGEPPAPDLKGRSVFETPGGQLPDQPAGNTEGTAGAAGDAISTLHGAIAELRAAGLNDKAIAALAEFELAPGDNPGHDAGGNPDSPARPRNPSSTPGAETHRPHRNSLRHR